jgi:hypothetical protein
MAEAQSDTSFYRLYPQHQYKSKILYDKDPIHGERNDNTIDWKPEKVPKIKSEKGIKLEDIEKEWHTGIYKNKDINTNPFPTVQSLYKFYHEPDFNMELPMFVPSDRIYLNTPKGIEEQWSIYLRKTRQSE